MAFTRAAAENVLKGFLGLTSGAILGHCFLGLSTSAPNSDGANFTEPSSSAGYGRVEFTNKSMTVTGASAENEAAIMFPEATSAWGTVVYFGLFASDSTTAPPLIYGALTSPVSANNIALFRPGNFTMSLS